MPARNADGTNTAQSVSAIAISAPPTSSIVSMGRFKWGHSGAHVALDVFDDDDRVVDDNCRADTWRKIFLQLLHLRQNFMLDRKGVCPGLGIDDQSCRIAAVHVGRVAVIR